MHKVRHDISDHKAGSMDITTDFEASSTCYRTVVTDLLKQLKQRGSDQAEILISDEAGYSIEVRDGAVDTLQHEHANHVLGNIDRQSLRMTHDFEPPLMLHESTLA